MEARQRLPGTGESRDFLFKEMSHEEVFDVALAGFASVGGCGDCRGGGLAAGKVEVPSSGWNRRGDLEMRVNSRRVHPSPFILREGESVWQGKTGRGVRP